MLILVTGGAGTVGRAAVAQLVENGHQVRVIGRTAGVAVAGAEYQTCDVTDTVKLTRAVAEAEAIVHLAAIPHPSGAAGPEIFRVNALGTYNVYEAAALAGVRRVVTASSINAFGYNFGVKAFPLLYFPIDEEHPALATDPYSFSKQVDENIAEYYWQREGVSGVCLRLPWVYLRTGERGRHFADVFRQEREFYAELFAGTTERRREHARAVHDAAAQMRRNRGWERGRRARLDGAPDRITLWLASAMTNMWTCIDAQDSARAIVRAVTGSYQGSHVLFVTENENRTGQPSEAMLQLFFPEVEARRKTIEGTGTVVSVDSARKLLGFQPQNRVRDWLEA